MSRSYPAARDLVRVPLVDRALPTDRPGRSKAELELAARMLDKLRAGEDIRLSKVAAARRSQFLDQLDDAGKLDVALDRLIDHLEGDAV